MAGKRDAPFYHRLSQELEAVQTMVDRFTNQHPDGYSSEEWWGLIAVTPDTNADGLYEWRPRGAFKMFQRQWQ